MLERVQRELKLKATASMMLIAECDSVKTPSRHDHIRSRRGVAMKHIACSFARLIVVGAGSGSSVALT